MPVEPAKSDQDYCMRVVLVGAKRFVRCGCVARADKAGRKHTTRPFRARTALLCSQARASVRSRTQRAGMERRRARRSQ